MNVLLSFVGRRDPFSNNSGKLTDGPLLSLLGKKKFDKLYLFYNDREYWERAIEIQKVCKERDMEIEILLRNIPVDSPTDYEQLFKQMNDKCQQLIEENSEEKPTYFIGTDSGTPQMQTIWFILANSGLVPASLLQGVPPKFGKGEYQVKEINLSLDLFPEFVSPDAIRRELDIIRSERDALRAERDALVVDYQIEGLVGKSPSFLSVVKKASLAAKSDVAVLIRGATGTGKELIAKGIHYKSLRKDKPFIALNCSAMPETLVESELFGHERGAFTGAEKQRKGKFELANGGTFFLDEVGDMPVTTQAKFLRVLQERELTRVGGSEEIKVDVRIIAATHQNLGQMIKEGTFRDDLYYRLRVIELQLPILIERSGDIPLLIYYFLDKLDRQYNTKRKLPGDVLRVLLSYTWPGNVRELENVIAGMYALSDGDELRLDALPNEILMAGSTFNKVEKVDVHIPAEGFDLKGYLRELEKAYFQKAIETYDGNRADAAKILRINPPAFRRRAREDFKI